METYGKYQIIRKIGVGGFGEVYKGFDPVIKRHLAIKTCSAGDELMRERFFREAEIAGNLHHRNITTVYDFGVEDGVPYLVQEFLTGEDLDTLIERAQPIAAEQKILYLLQIARGLEYSHEKGVIHRDIKPANIRILEDGTAKVMDYGIAKLKHQESGLTRTGTTLGTTAYLAPEQVRGLEVDERTDIFSFGALAYEMMTYQRPFKGDTFSSIMYQIIKEDPQPILDCCPDCPPGLAALIERCMRKEPEERFQSFAEVLTALDEVRGAAGVAEAAPAGPEADGSLAERSIDLGAGASTRRRGETADRPRRSAVWTLALGAAVVLGGIAWWLLARASDTGTPSGTVAQAGQVDAPGEPGGDAPAGPGEEPDAGPQPGEGPADNSPPLFEPEPEPPPIEAPPPPDPGPPPAALRVARAWSGQMTVAVNGASPRALDRERSWELPPGRHRLVFALETDGYSATETLDLELAPGQSQRIEAPIARPGLLTVQAYVGAAQGRVLVDGGEIGRSPVRLHAISPGSHRLQVLPPADAALTEVSQDVTIASGQEMIVTFDLAGQRELLVLERPMEAE